MLHTIFGLPAHVLLIHAIVVLAPVGALFTVLSGVWPAARAKLGVISPLTCLAVLVLVPVTTNAGEWLRNRIDPNRQNPAIQRHADLGGTFLYFAIALAVVSVAVWWIGRRYQFGLVGMRRAEDGAPNGSGGGVAVATRTDQRTMLSTAVSVVIAVVSVAVAAATAWQLYRIGDTGAHAVWDGIVTR